MGGGGAKKILRASINAFFQGYPSFSSVAALLVLPCSAALLLSQTLTTTSPSLLQFIARRLRSLLLSSSPSLPLSSPLLSLFTLMLSQSTFSSLLTLPFSLSFLLLAKASIVLIISRRNGDGGDRKQSLASILALYPSLLLTNLLTSVLFVSAHASVFSLLFIALSLLDFADIPSTSTVTSLLLLTFAVLYSVIVASTAVVCSLATIVSAAERRGGILPVIRAYLLVRGRLGTALSVAVPTNMAAAAVEALFHYRVVRAYRASSGRLSASVVSEGFTVAYMHAIVVVVEVIAGCLFYESCCRSCDGKIELEPEEKKGEV